MRTLIVGLGSIGRRHLRNLRLINPESEIIVLRREGSLPVSEEELADCVVRNLSDAIHRDPEIAFITSPAPFHIPVGYALAQSGTHLFIEKPISNQLDGVQALINLCQQKGLVLLLGYNLRFDHALQAIKRVIDQGEIGKLLTLRAEVGQYLPDWRPNSDYQQNVSAKKELGGGAILELSHEIDYVRWLMGEVEQVTAVVDRLSDLDIDVEDTAEILLRFANGAIGSIHLDMVQRAPTRTCRIVGSEGTIVWDGIANTAQLYRPSLGKWESLLTPMTSSRNDTYVAEIQHFVDCVQGKATPLITGHDGLQVLKIALAAKQSAIEGRTLHL